MSEATTNVEENSDSNREQWPTEATRPAALNQIQMPAWVQQPSMATTTSMIPQNVIPYLPHRLGDQFFSAYHYVMPWYGFMPVAPAQQFHPLRPIAPKAQEHSNQPANRALSRPPDFIETKNTQEATIWTCWHRRITRTTWGWSIFEVEKSSYSRMETSKYAILLY